MEGFLDLKTIYTIAHAFGVTIGAGSAFIRDIMFLFSTKDKIITHSELRFLELSSVMVWVGVFLMIISSLFLFSTNPSGYLASSDFLVKMVIVAFISVNGITFHFVHIPVFAQILGTSIVKSNIFKKRSKWIYTSCGLSVMSWFCVIALGSVRGNLYAFWHGFGMYLLLVFIGAAVALVYHNQFFKQ